MLEDPIVAEVRRIREQLAARFNYDVHAMFAHMRSQESQYGARLIRQPPRQTASPPPVKDSTLENSSSAS